MLNSNKKLIISKPLVQIALFLIFCLAYLISPYWILLPGTVVAGTAAVFTLAVAMFWSRYAAADLSIATEPSEFWFFILIFLAALLWYWNALHVDLAWRGDEDDHLSYVLSLLQKSRLVINKLSGIGFLFAIGITSALMIFLWVKRRTWFYGFISVAMIAVIALAFIANDYVEFDYLLRYPYINRWIHSIPVIILNAAGMEANESLYRIIPFVSTVLLAFLAFHYLRDSWLLALLVSYFVMTIPIIDYYATVLYLEMPVVLLLTVALLGGGELLQAKFDELKMSLSWYALLLAGFFKETVLPVLLVLLGLRGLYQLRYRSGKSILSTVWQELVIGFLVLLPLATYLTYRMLLSDHRSYSANPAHLLDPEMWQITFQATLDQMLMPAVLAISGMAVLFIQGRLAFLLLLLLSWLSSLVFFALDNPAYWGYSRFNLFLLPPLLAASLIFIRHLLDTGNKNTLYGIVAIAIAVNLVQRPMNLSGVRMAEWGVYKEKTAEYYYPYRNALRWLHNNVPDKKTLIAGAYYPYKYSYYTDLWQWQADISQRLTQKEQVDIELFRLTCQKAALDGYSVLLFQMTGRRLANASAGTSCEAQKSFQYNDNEIVIYYIH